jgi:luciferase-type oxidoreductase
MNKLRYGQGFNSVYAEGQLTLGINFPIEAYSSPIPCMEDQVALAQKAEQGGFAALWSRDVPLYAPSFGDVGQIYDPWVWLGYITALTSKIALGTGSIILPLRKPVDLAKAAASIDQLSKGRLILGVATGDRPVEYSIYEVPFETRDQAFRDSFELIRSATHRPQDWDDRRVPNPTQVHLLPKSYAADLPLIVTGNSRQSLDWIAANADGWLMYPRPIEQQQQVVTQWQATLANLEQGWKPFSQSLYIDLAKDPNASKQPIHLGYRLGRNTLLSHLQALRDIGVNHVSFNVRFSTRPIDEVLDELSEYILPEFPVLNQM